MQVKLPQMEMDSSINNNNLDRLNKFGCNIQDNLPNGSLLERINKI
jgi:hypothetical protein